MTFVYLSIIHILCIGSILSRNLVEPGSIIESELSLTDTMAFSHSFKREFEGKKSWLMDNLLVHGDALLFDSEEVNSSD